MTTHFVGQEGGETITKNRETGRSTKQSTATPKDKRCCCVCLFRTCWPQQPWNEKPTNSQRQGKIKCKKKRMANSMNCWRKGGGWEWEWEMKENPIGRFVKKIKPQIICQTQSNGKHLGRGRTCCTYSTSKKRNRPFNFADEREKKMPWKFLTLSLGRNGKRQDDGIKIPIERISVLSRSRSQSQV